MIKNLTLMFALFFIWNPCFVNADSAFTDLVKFHNASNMVIPFPGNCPKTDVLDENKEWVEHTEVWNKKMRNILAMHFSLPFAPVKPSVFFTHLPVKVDRGMGIAPWSELVWTIYRSNQTNYHGKSNNCHVMGTVAYYIERRNKNGWPPKVQFLNQPKSEKQWLRSGEIGLIELRWYDPVGKRRHRWFNRPLALSIHWVKGNNFSPIFLPRAINTLY